MAETVFTCGQVLCLIDGVLLYGIEQSYENNRVLGEYLTGVPAPSLYMNTEKIAEISIWLIAIETYCGEKLKRQMTLQYPAAFAHVHLRKLVDDSTLAYPDMLKAYRQKARSLKFDLDTPLTLKPLTPLEKQSFYQLLTDHAFRKNCLEILAAGTNDYVSEPA